MTTRAEAIELLEKRQADIRERWEVWRKAFAEGCLAEGHVVGEVAVGLIFAPQSHRWARSTAAIDATIERLKGEDDAEATS